MKPAHGLSCCGAGKFCLARDTNAVRDTGNSFAILDPHKPVTPGAGYYNVSLAHMVIISIYCTISIIGTGN